MVQKSQSGATSFTSNGFVIGAGCILFRKSPANPDEIEICLIHEPQKNKWLLPKGRKECGEAIEVAAVRETFEETGYPCELMPIRMPTRALVHGGNDTDQTRLIDNINEPIGITLRNLGEEPEGMKIVWWFIGRVKGSGLNKVEGTQMESENYTSHFFDASEAMKRLTYTNDQELVVHALTAVQDNVNERGVQALFD